MPGIAWSRGGLTATHNATYHIWKNMKSRCEKRHRPDYGRYGARGIKVCERWQSFENFLADMGDRPEGLQLDRIDSSKGYEPDNCRWVTPKVNARNRRVSRWVEFRGEQRRVADLAEEFDIEVTALHKRLDAGWPTEEALTRPGAARYFARPSGERHKRAQRKAS